MVQYKNWKQKGYRIPQEVKTEVYNFFRGFGFFVKPRQLLDEDSDERFYIYRPTKFLWYFKYERVFGDLLVQYMKNGYAGSCSFFPVPRTNQDINPELIKAFESFEKVFKTNVTVHFN
jgi:hypothetical protein